MDATINRSTHHAPQASAGGDVVASSLAHIETLLAQLGSPHRPGSSSGNASLLRSHPTKVDDDDYTEQAQAIVARMSAVGMLPAPLSLSPVLLAGSPGGARRSSEASSDGCPSPSLHGSTVKHLSGIPEELPLTLVEGQPAEVRQRMQCS